MDFEKKVYEEELENGKIIILKMETEITDEEEMKSYYTGYVEVKENNKYYKTYYYFIPFKGDIELSYSGYLREEIENEGRWYIGIHTAEKNLMGISLEKVKEELMKIYNFLNK